MTTWDERAMERANLLYPSPEDEQVSGKYTLDDLRSGKRDAFIAGAGWQRGQHLTDETVDRAARALNKDGWTCMGGWHEPGEYDECDYCREICRSMARTALTVAIGDPE